MARSARTLLLRTLCLILLASVAPLGSTAAENGPPAESAPPRMWEVTGKAPNGNAVKFYILAGTHNGLDVEYDAYFRNKVIPVFDQSTVFSFEGASLASTQAPECPVHLDQTKENIEILRWGRDRVREAILQRLIGGKQPTGLSKETQSALQESAKIFAKSITDGLSEYGLILPK